MFGANRASSLSQTPGSLSLSCPTARISLHALTNTGTVDPVEILSADLQPDGSFSLTGLRQQQISLSSKVHHILRASGCGQIFYRPLTGNSAQLISGSSTLLVFSTEMSDPDRRPLDQLSPAEVQTALTQLETLKAPDLSSLLDALVGSSPLTQIYQDLTHLAPSRLREMPPSSVNVIAPLNVPESASRSYSATTSHWVNNYQAAYEWSLDGTVVSTSSSWTYTTHADSQGPHALTLRIGTLGAGGLLDSEKPWSTRSFDLVVSDDHPATPPSLSLVGAMKRNFRAGSVQMATGSGLSGCATFSSLALTEDPYVPPLSAAAYVFTCSQATTQLLPFTLSDQDGAKVLALWARDSAGHISTSPSTVSVVLDRAPPETSLGSLPTGVRGGSVLSIAHSASDTISGLHSLRLEYAENGTDFSVLLADLTSASSPYSWTLPSVNTGTAKIRLTAADEAGNSVETLSAPFLIDSAAPVTPAVSLTSPALTNSLSASLSVTCSADHHGVFLSESASAPSADTPGWISCSAAPPSFTLSAGDGAKTIYLFAKDALGNVQTTPATTPLTLDQTPPVLTLTSTLTASQKSGTSAQLQFRVTESNITPSQSFKIEYSTNNGTSWNIGETMASPNGPLNAQSFTSSMNWPDVNSDQFKIRLSAVDAAGNPSVPVISSPFTVDKSDPSISGLTVNSGASSTSSNYVSVSFTVNDNFSAQSFCLKYNSTSAPSSSDSCWIPVSSSLAGSRTPGPSVSITDYAYALGFGAGTFNITAWAKDLAGRVSSLSNSGNGTLGQDLATITYNPGSAPTIRSISATGVDLPANPAGLSDLAAPSGYDVYIRWRVTDDKTLPATPVSLYYYSAGDWQPIPTAQNLINGVNGSCTADDPTTSWIETGCYKWSGGSPSSSSYQIQIRVTDSDSMTALTSSSILNPGNVRALAGNTDPGVNGSARSAVFYSNTAGEYTQVGKFVVTPQGLIFYTDGRGLFRIKPDDGILKLYIKTTGTLSGVDGPVTSATINTINRIILDHEGRVIFSTASGIFRFDPKLASPILERLYSGFKTAIAALPNGQLYLVDADGASGSNAMTSIYLYDLPTSTLSALSISGTTNAYGTVADVTVCTSSRAGWGLSYHLVTSQLTWLQNTVNQCGTSTNPLVVYDPQTLVSRPLYSVSPASYASHPKKDWSHLYTPYTGMNGDLYLISYTTGRVYHLNPLTQIFELIVGTLVGPGVCGDNIQAQDCRISPQDMFVDLAGKVYVLDGGRIRVIQNDKTMLSLYGSWMGDGDGGDPLAARINGAEIMVLGGGSKILFLQTDLSLIREFSYGSTIERVVGNGNSSNPTVGGGPSESIIGSLGWGYPNKFLYNSGNGDLYLSGKTQVYKFNRSSNIWSVALAGAATGTDAFTTAADGLLPTAIRFTAEYIVPLEMVGSRLHLQLFSQIPGYSSQINVIKAYDMADSYRQSHIAGLYSTTPAPWCNAGDNINSCQVLPRSIATPTLSYDPTGQKWFVTSNTNGTTIMSWNSTGVVTTYPTAKQARAQAYRRVSGSPDTEILYYCGSDGSLRRYNITTPGETVLAIPSLMTCDGRTLIWDEANNRLVFAYRQNSLWGIAEYLNPP